MDYPGSGGDGMQVREARIFGACVCVVGRGLWLEGRSSSRPVVISFHQIDRLSKRNLFWGGGNMYHVLYIKTKDITHVYKEEGYNAWI